MEDMYDDYYRVRNDTLKAVLTHFVPRMAHKWDSIGIQLAQAERVSQLRNSPEPNEKKMQDILDAWIGSSDRFLINTRSLLESLMSSDVGLHDVAKYLEEAADAEDRRLQKDLKRQQEEFRRFEEAQMRRKEEARRRGTAPPQPTPRPPQPTPQPPQPTLQPPQPTPDQAKRVLEFFREMFISEVASKDIVHDLQHKDIIPNGVLNEVRREPDVALQNRILYAHLESTCTWESLMTLCETIIAVPGNPRMKRFGENMKSKLEDLTRDASST